GKQANWVDIGMTVDGRDTPAHIAVMSQNPMPWRVDGQLGVGPAPSRSGAWKLLKGETATMRYRFYVYTGAFNHNQVDGYWQALDSIK
ncbi:MAG TPA: DUF6807 family protein, partial [Gemmataceae bacterium]|nr:DUF6807 family protein [Gemmataceae bacterium]